MSRVSTANSAVPRSPSNAMQLPNIPRLTADEKSRSKYISDYERFEPELRRHHMGTAETTNTLGLKDVPADFDRTVPSLSAPTRAELELERQKPHRTRSANRALDRGAAERSAQTPSPLSEAVAAKRAAAATAHATSLPTPPQTRAVVLAEGSRPPSGRRPSLDAPLPKEGKELPAFVAAAAIAAPDAAEATSGAAAAATELPVAAAAEPTPAATTAHTARSPAAAPTASLLKKSGPKAKVPMSLPRMRSAPPLAKTGGPALAAATSLSAERKRNTTRCSSARHAQTDASPPPPAGKAAAPAAETARVLCVLLDPPPQYVSSLELDLSCYDLGWMRSGAAPPRHLTTIANYIDIPGSQMPPAKINSPRSVMALLEHGVSLKDWVASEAETSTSSAAALPNVGARLQAELQQHRRTHQQEQQKAMRERLEKTYHALCSRAPLQDVLACYRQARYASLHPDAGIGAEEKAALSTAVLQRQERQRRVFDTNKMRMLRQVQQAKELQERKHNAERRQQQAEADAQEERRQKAAEEDTARRLQQERLESRRAEREQREEAMLIELQSRMTKVEARNAERAAARERQQRLLQEEREAQAAERARRMERNTALLEEQAALQEQKRVEKEKKVEELRLAREVRLAEEQRQQLEKQQRAAQQRDEARQRATEAEEAAKAAAVERQAQAEARLQEFYARRREEAVQRAAAEAQHQKRLEARMEAFAKEEKVKSAIREKLQQHEERYHDTRAKQLADIAWRREAEREEQEDKAYAVLQLQRKAEFQKLHTVADLLEKRKAANAITRQRELVCEQSMRDREALREERNALKEQLAKTAP